MHVILDCEADKQMIRWLICPLNVSHKHAKVWAWLARHPRWAFHFTPTSCSWLNVVEGLFAKVNRGRTVPNHHPIPEIHGG